METDMQSSIKETSGDDESGSSLFHQRLTHRMQLHPNDDMKFLLHRLSVAGRLSCGLADRQAVGVHYERFNYSLQRSRPGEDVTGLLLLYPQHALHVIECSTEVLVSVLQDLRNMQINPDSGLILEPKVLLVSHDIRTRLFQQWSYKLLNESEGGALRSSEEQSSEKLLMDTVQQLLRIGCHLLNAGENVTGSEALQDGSHLIPPQAALSRLVHTTALLSPAQYLSTYHSPVHQHLDSEFVWPTADHPQVVRTTGHWLFVDK